MSAHLTLAEIAFFTAGIVGFACLPWILALLFEKGFPDFIQGIVDFCDWVDGTRK